MTEFVAMFSNLTNDNRTGENVEDQDRVRTATVRFKNVDVNLWNLYLNNTKIYENLTCEHMTQIFNNEKLDLSDSKFKYLTDSVFFSWTNLTKPLKDKFLSSTILFRGQNVKLKDLYAVYPKAFESLTSKQIMTVLDGHSALSIEKIKELSTKFYVKRKFIPENSIVAQIEYEKTAFGANKSFKSFYESRPKANLTENLKKHRENYGSHVANSVDRISEYAAIGKLMGYKDFHKSFEKDTEDSRIFVLSSEAGAGKTVTFKHLAIELKKQHPTKWVSYIDLKDHVTWYQDDLVSGGIEELLKKILNLTTENEFERKIFEDSYKAGQVVLLWNGFDEISPLYETFILKITKNVLEKTNNTQYICTRPSHSTQLNENFNVDSQMLVPFNEDEQIEFLNEYFKAKNIKNSSIINEMVSRVLNVTKKLIYNEKRQYDTPLLLSMFAEVKTDNPNLIHQKPTYSHTYPIIQNIQTSHTHTAKRKNKKRITTDVSVDEVQITSTCTAYGNHQ
ncbi:unnamed protein product [Chironomus riparius]|uniref:NACHT domain-containing protein n=1 Tax=Chironomus riparius TaxID=315576 RepID=A0A9N9S6U2_9DIPT|nr:unnamed protein product [Chironomus riparius]